MEDALRALSGETIVMVDPQVRIDTPGTRRILNGVTLMFASGRRVTLSAQGDEEGFGSIEVLTEDEGDN